jgi:hypothetical protein
MAAEFATADGDNFRAVALQRGVGIEHPASLLARGHACRHPGLDGEPTERHTFRVSADVAVIRDGRPRGTLRVSSAVDVNHVLFASPSAYSNRARDLALEDLARKVAMELGNRGDWLSGSE